MEGILHNWEAYLLCGLSKDRRVLRWTPPLVGLLKFNIDGAARGKLGSVGIDGVLRDSNGLVLMLFSKHVGVMDSNESEVLPILEALHVFYAHIVESDSMIVVAWVLFSVAYPCRFHFHFNDIKFLASRIQVWCNHVGLSANALVDPMGKLGMVRFSPPFLLS